ncbi:MAG: hypothetical protein E6K04_05770 [Methanobacteriota archaeon]|nr:MAG: hypothetical protein E6K04_05770 [Euryarchaeota archaeon]
MALRNCPVCHASVKLENLERHVANVHPRQKPSLAISANDRRIIQEKRRISTPGFHIPRSVLVIILAVPLMLGGIIVAYPYVSTGGAIHWHPQLTITIDGQSATIPANIGIDSSLWQDHSLDQYSSMPDMPDGMSGMAPLHTHDTSGTIHVESRVSREYTLGDFFRIWGQTFDAQQVLGHQAQTGHRVWMVVDGSTMSPSYSVVLRDQMRIQIICGAG